MRTKVTATLPVQFKNSFSLLIFPHLFTNFKHKLTTKNFLVIQLEVHSLEKWCYHSVIKVKRPRASDLLMTNVRMKIYCVMLQFLVNDWCSCMNEWIAFSKNIYLFLTSLVQVVWYQPKFQPRINVVSTLWNDTTSVSDVETTLKQRWYNFISTFFQRGFNIIKSYQN